MGGLLSHPVTIKSSDSGEKLGLRYGLSSMQGWRSEMEDAHDVQLGLKFGLDDWSFFAVFDGHAGKRAAGFASCNLLDYILRDSQFKLGTGRGWGPVDVGPQGERLERLPSAEDDFGLGVENYKTHSTSSPADENTKRLLADNMGDENETQDQGTNHQKSSSGEDASEDQEKNESKFNSSSVPEQLDMVTNAIRSGFLKIDQGMRVSAKDLSGCTAVCALISPTHIFIANCGDSRAVLYDGTRPKFVTEDHKPFNPAERKRIETAGGVATQRINGTLAVSRALGDFDYKKDLMRGPCEQLVSPEPEVTVIERQPTDEFLILACDGIWDVMNNEDLCRFVRHKLLIESSLENICSSVLDVCLRKGSRDNMSMILVVFDTGPKVSESEVIQDKKNDEILLKIAKSVFDSQQTSNFHDFLSNLETELSHHTEVVLPPGAGIEAKYDLLRETFYNEPEDQEKQGEQE